MLKLAALGAIGYFGYNYYKKHGNPFDGSASTYDRNAAAGGPLSDQARVQPTPPA